MWGRERVECGRGSRLGERVGEREWGERVWERVDWERERVGERECVGERERECVGER